PVILRDSPRNRESTRRGARRGVAVASGIDSRSGTTWVSGSQRHGALVKAVHVGRFWACARTELAGQGDRKKDGLARPGVGRRAARRLAGGTQDVHLPGRTGGFEQRSETRPGQRGSSPP